MKQQLIFPMAFYVFYIFLLAVSNFIVRVRAVKAGKINAKYFKAYTGEIPERVIVMGRHYDNQFQLPPLFLIGCCAFLAIDKVSSMTVDLAWAFVAARLCHSIIHLGHNHIQTRLLVFTAGWLVTIVLWGQLVYFAAQ